MSNDCLEDQSTINHPRNDRSRPYTTEEKKEESTYKHIIDHLGKSWRLKMGLLTFIWTRLIKKILNEQYFSHIRHFDEMAMMYALY
jgi:hypothetical protein